MSTMADLLATNTKQSQMSSLFIDQMGLVSVKSYGAEGDGVTNDTVAIQLCIAAATAADLGSIFFPHGTYLVDAGLSTELDGFFLWGDNSTVTGDTVTINQMGPNLADTITAHLEDLANPHQVTKAQLGLADVPNTDFTSAVNLNTTHRGLTDNPHTVTTTQLGLENVDNTSDEDKPISTAQAAVNDLKANLTGATFTGAVTGMAPTTDYHLATKKYTDDKIFSNVAFYSVAEADILPDGSDITTKLNALLANASYTDRILWFPDGDYTVNGQIQTIEGNYLTCNYRKATITFSGYQAQHIRLVDNVTIENFVLTGGESVAIRAIEDGNNVKLKGLEIYDFDNKGISFWVEDGLLYENVWIQDCYIHDMGDAGIAWYGRYSYGMYQNVVIKDCLIEDCGNLSTAVSSEATVGFQVEWITGTELSTFYLENVEINRCWENGFYSSQSHARIVYNNCRTSENGLDVVTLMFGHGFRASTTTEVLCRDCLSVGNAGDGFAVRTADNAEKLQLINCVSEENNACGFSFDVQPMDDELEIEVIGCETNNNDTFGLWLKSTRTYLDDKLLIRIKDNHFNKDCQTAGTPPTNLASVYMYSSGVDMGASRIIFKGNVVDNNITTCRTLDARFYMYTYATENVYLGVNNGFLNQQPLYYSKDGIPSGTTAERPTDIITGYSYLDTTLTKVITYTGSVWIDAMGTTV